ncbi:Conjugative transposon protein TraO, partial [human gut metagenome]
MKRAAFILVLALSLTCTAGKSFAQRTLPGMRGLELRSGMVDGWYSSSPSSATGYYFGLAMSRYSKNANKWVYGIEYLNRGYPYKSERIPMAQFTGEGGYYYKFLSDVSKTFFFYLGGSAMAGYETVNWGDRLLSD